MSLTTRQLLKTYLTPDEQTSFRRSVWTSIWLAVAMIIGTPAALAAGFFVTVSIGTYAMMQVALFVGVASAFVVGIALAVACDASLKQAMLLHLAAEDRRYQQEKAAGK